MAKLKRVFTNASLFAGSLLIVLLLTEFAFRIFYPQQLILLDSAEVWVPKDTIGYANKPLANTQINTGERTVSYRTNSEGHRIAQDPITKADKNILFLGDSYLHAIQVEAEDIFCHKTAQLLSDTQTVSYTSTGSGGYNPNQYLIALKKEVRRKKYDLVVTTLYLPNDCVDSVYTYQPPIPSQMLQDVNFSSFFDWRNFGVNVLRPINEVLERNSHVYVFGKRRLKPILVSLLENTQYIEDPFLFEKSTSLRWTSTSTILHAIDATAQANGIPCLFVLIPSSYQVDEELWKIHLAADGLTPKDAYRFLPNQKIDSLGKDLAILDLTKAMLQSDAPLFGSVDAHFNNAGHELAAREISRFILENELLTKTTDTTEAVF